VAEPPTAADRMAIWSNDPDHSQSNEEAPGWHRGPEDNK
jgi:hypothetical protein